MERANHNQRDTAGERKLGRRASSPETASAVAPVSSRTRRWLGVGGRSWQVASRSCAEGESPLPGAAFFYEVYWRGLCVPILGLNRELLRETLTPHPEHRRTRCFIMPRDHISTGSNARVDRRTAPPTNPCRRHLYPPPRVAAEMANRPIEHGLAPTAAQVLHTVL